MGVKKFNHTIDKKILKLFEKNMKKGVQDFSDEDWLIIMNKLPLENIENFKNSKRLQDLPLTSEEYEIILFAKSNNNPLEFIAKLKSLSKNETDVYNFIMLSKNADPRIRKNSYFSEESNYGTLVTFDLFLELWKYDIVKYVNKFYTELSKKSKMDIFNKILNKKDIDTYYLSELIKMWGLQKEFTENILTIYNISQLVGDLNHYHVLYLENLNFLMKKAYENWGHDLLFFISYNYPNDFIAFMNEKKISTFYQNITTDVSQSQEKKYANWALNLFGYIPLSNRDIILEKEYQKDEKSLYQNYVGY